jgi:serine/threonine-protein kinase
VLGGHYKILYPIGHGSMGTVFRGRDVARDRLVALKLLGPRYRNSPDTVQKFLSSAEAFGKVRHPGLVSIVAVGNDAGLPFVAMDYVEGRTLAARLRLQGRFPAREAARIGARLCEALASVHAAGLVHRDVKSQNVMQTPDGRYILLDLGICRDLGDGPSHRHLVAGSPAYMPPEHPERTDARSDLYSLGIVLYEMATGRLPFRAGSVRELILAHYFDAPPSPIDVAPDLPPVFAEIVEKAVARHPSHRFQSAEELRERLLAFFVTGEGRAIPVEEKREVAVSAGGPSQAAPVLEPPPPERPPAPRHLGGARPRESSGRRRALALGLGALMLGCGTAAIWVLSREPAAAVPAPAAPAAASSSRVEPSPPKKGPAPPTPVVKTPRRSPERALGKVERPAPARAKKKKRAPKPAVLAALATRVPPAAEVAAQARLTVFSSPPGASVRTGTRRLGTTPLRNVELPPGAHDIVVELHGRRPWRRTANLRAAESTTLSAELHALSATLQIVTHHEGQATWATLTLDGRPLGDTNAVRREVPVGTHRVVARRSGFREAAAVVTLGPGETKKVILVLEKN